MKKIFLIFTAALAVACAQKNHESSVLNVVPYPNEVEIGEGVFDAKGVPVTYAEAIDEASVNVIRLFAEKLSQVSGVENSLEVGSADKEKVRVQRI